jgi:3-oxoacyl-[acyl-carrier protein] reductase
MRLEGKAALVTGASRNIGREIALTFAREGADLVLNTRQSAKELDEVAAQCRELGVRTVTAVCDVGDADSVRRMVSDGIDQLGKIDVLVSNVAIRPHKPITEVSDDEWQQVMNTNLNSAFYLSKAVLPEMLERRSGSIIALGGQSSITGRPNTTAVTAAKTGLLGLIRAIAAEAAPHGVRANMVNPGSTDTSREHPEWYPEFQGGMSRGSNQHLQDLPMGRQATVQDVANACLFFASDESAYITGDSVNVMGGRYIV